MATKARIKGDEIVSVYDDRFRPLFDLIGQIEVERATEVEFDPKSGYWIATYLKTGEVIGEGRERGRVIQEEVAWLENNVI